MRKTLLDVIAEYDQEQRSYANNLELENEELREKNMELVAQLASYVQTVDRMKLELIMSGSLHKPVASTTGKQVHAPWTASQVASLNAYQTAGYVHPFTSSSGDSLKVDLIATRVGWVETTDGPIVQTWAHAFMCDWSWRIPELDNINPEDMR
jgi:hypothetical protein